MLLPEAHVMRDGDKSRASKIFWQIICREGHAVEARERVIVAGVIVSFVALCLASICILPPFEGFDETAHYSYITTLTDRHTNPDFRQTLLDLTVEREAQSLPRPYRSIRPFENNGGWTYATFFGSVSAAERRQIISRFWQPPGRAVEYETGSLSNWQGQHPPLYYAIMAPAYHVSRSWSGGARLFFLRLVSVLLASASLVFWWKSVRTVESPMARQAVLLSGVVVLFLPSCWYDLARIGNDSLVAVCLSAVIFFLLRTHRSHQQSLGDFVGLAVALGCGLLTKSFFVPISVGVVVFITWHGVGPCCLSWRAVLLRWTILAGIAGLMAGPWFLQCWFRYGMLVPSSEAFSLNTLAVMPGDSLSFMERCLAMCRSCLAFGATFLWSGGWSWIKRPLWQYGMMFPFLILGLSNLWRKERWGCPELNHLTLATICMLIPLMASFLWYMHLRVRWTGIGSGVGGYYLFSCWPLVGLALWQTLDLPVSRTGKAALMASLVLAIAFEISGIWFSCQIYAGIVQKLGSVSAGVGGRLPTPENLRLVFSRLQEFVLPGWALMFYIVSLVARAITITAIFNRRCRAVD